ncbi:MAG TPA: cob(I)yrinic acid a,c-diamide adenosyltransferase [Pedomonas sp.]|uniref:cob(I)yrinic acid a,c-diamide adenosyltransferase n=1 Tax=Pedomonas sp. TaxID=2976421 RepID=UPI002F3F8D4C
MVKLTKIYTRGGDQGQTSLVDGSRLPKHAIRIEAYGTVDEASSVIGIARLHTAGNGAEDIDAALSRIQNDLFDLGADLATPGTDMENALRIQPQQVERLEREIDALNAELQPLNSFILPGGSAASAYLHLARTVVRRAERMTTAAAEQEPINPVAIQYLNRLSDYMFVLARYLNGRGEADVLWVPGANR